MSERGASGTASASRSLVEAFPRFRAGDRSTVRVLGDVRERARAFAQQHVQPLALEIDRRAAADPRYVDWDLIRAGCEHGLLSLAIPTAASGQGGLAREMCVALEELCAACPGVGNIFGAHGLGLLPLLATGVTHWDGVLRDIAVAERQGRPVLMACAVTEPDAGTDVEEADLMRRGRITSQARPVTGGWRLTGTKRFISNGSLAEWITVCMPFDPQRPAETWTCFLVDARSEGFSVGRVEHKMGQRACPAAELVFDDVFVPDDLVVGRPGDGMPTTYLVLAASRPAVAAIATGIARGAYDRVLTWLEHEPALLGRQQVQLALARMEEEIHLARQSYLDAATELDVMISPALRHPLVRAMGLVPPAARRVPRVRRWITSPRSGQATVALLHRTMTNRAVTRSLALSSLAKAHAADVAMSVTGLALELAGLDSGDIRAELEKLWRDAKLTQIYEGTNQLNRLTVYRGLSRGETMQALPPSRRDLVGRQP